MHAARKPPDPPARGGVQLTTEGTVWLGAAVILGLVGWYKSINLLLLLAYVMGGVLALNAAVARAHARRVRAARVPAPPGFADDPPPAAVTATNVGRTPAVVTLVDSAGTACAWFVHQLPAGECRELRLARPPLGRGRYPALPLVVRSGYPFGLVRAVALADGPADPDLLVLPARGAVDSAALRDWLLRAAGGGGRSRRVLRRVTTDQADVRGVRPYRPGESRRWVHWKSTARRGELMVREYDAAPSPDLLLVLDPWLPATPTPADRDRLEAALSLAASILLAWSDGTSNRVGLLIPGAPPAFHATAATPLAVNALLAMLADVEGVAAVPVPPPAAYARTAASAARLVVGTRAVSPVAAELAAKTGRPCPVACPDPPPAWYLSPNPRRA